MQPAIRQWWLDILRSCAWFLLKGILFIIDILYDIVMYITSLDFLSSSQVGLFYDKYKVFLILFLTIAMAVLGIMIMNVDNQHHQKSKLKNALYGVMVLFLFSTIYPLLNEASLGFNQLIGGNEEQSLSVRLVQSSTKRLMYADGQVTDDRTITVDEAKLLLQEGETVNAYSGYTFGKDAYDYDIGWLTLSVVALIMVPALAMLGHNAFRIIVDIGWVKILSIFALPMSIVSEGARKKFILETFKTFATLPITLLAFAFFLRASSWLMSLEIFTSTYLLKYKNTFAEGYVSALFYGISLSSLAAVVLDGSARTVGLLGIDTGIKSPAGAIAMMRAGQSAKGVMTGVAGLGSKTIKSTNRGASALGKGAVSAAGFGRGMTEAMKDKKNNSGSNDESGGQGKSQTRREANRTTNRGENNFKTDRINNISNKVHQRYKRGSATGYNAVKSVDRARDKIRRRGDR